MRAETIQLLSIILVSIIIGFSQYKNSKRPYRLLLFLLITTFLAETLAEYCAHAFRNNLFVYHFFHPVEYTLLALIFYNLIESNSFKKFILFSVALYTPLSVWNSLYLERFAEYKINTTAILVESILLVMFALQVLLEFLKKPFYENIYSQPSFWISLGVLIFFSTNIFFWGYYSRLANNAEGVQLFYKILFYENLVLYFLFGVALVLVRIQNSSRVKNTKHFQ